MTSVNQFFNFMLSEVKILIIIITYSYNFNIQKNYSLCYVIKLNLDIINGLKTIQQNLRIYIVFFCSTGYKLHL